MTVDGENRQLICETHSGPEYYTEYYAYDHTGQLYLARRDTQDLSLNSGPVYSESFDHPANDWRGGSYAALTADELAASASPTPRRISRIWRTICPSSSMTTADPSRT